MNHTADHRAWGFDTVVDRITPSWYTSWYSWAFATPPTYVSVEGLVGAGKSTALAFLEQSGLSVVQEPLSEWVVNGQEGREFNVLEEFYRDPAKRAYLFQSFCLRTRCKIMKQLQPNTLYLIERGVDADGIFGAIQHENGCIDDVEYAVYLYNLARARDDTPRVSGRIYIKTSVETCMERIASRKRKGEENIDEHYLTQLEEKHEEWMEKEDNVLVIDGEADFTDVGVQINIVKRVKSFLKNIN